jgi:hypothetical protein
MGLLDELNKFVNQIESLKDKLTAKNAIIYDIITITMDYSTLHNNFFEKMTNFTSKI